MSDHVVSAISESGVVENVGAAAGTASILFPFKSYYNFRFWWPPFFISDVGRCLTMSSVPYLSPAWSIIWGQLLEPHRNLFPFKRHFYFRFWLPPFFYFGCRPMSDNVASDISESGVVENVGVAVGTPSKSISVQKSLLLPVCFVGRHYC